jgi:RNA recognition motif-containing protein
VDQDAPAADDAAAAANAANAAPAADDAAAVANADVDIKAEPQGGDDQQGGQAYDNDKPIELYVGNLSFSTRDADLEGEFRTEVPGLISALVCMDKFNPTRSRGFAFCKVHTQEDADKIIAKYNDFELQGRTIKVNIAGQKPDSSRVTTTNNGGPGETELYVGSLAWATSDADLEKHFGAHGTVVSARVVMDRQDSTRSRGFAFVKAASLEDAKEMVAKLDGQDLQGRNLKVNIATGKSDRPSGGRGGGGGYGGGGYGGGGYGGGGGGNYGSRNDAW